ncbi:MAG: prepilin-type N-terminal cleavage/methylation domain-containing protein [Candidatus Omnitrophica bacterium]|nr:prepilin-type N-terminal cleavage/methylation domain-containing protein [Candidatus Omnitrophota bacterium]
MRNSKGLTLIELLIAVSILSIIILSLYSTFRSGLSSYEKIDFALETYQSARIVLNRLNSDLKNSFVYLKSDSGFKGETNELQFFTVIEAFGNNKNYPFVAKVKYKLSGVSLSRLYYKNMDSVNEDGAEGEEEIFPGIKDISFQYAFPDTSGDELYKWQDSWPSPDKIEQRQTLPLAVKIDLSVIEKARPGREVSIIKFSKIVGLR